MSGTMFDYQQRPSNQYSDKYDKIQWNSQKMEYMEKQGKMQIDWDTDNEPEEGEKREEVSNGCKNKRATGL